MKVSYANLKLKTKTDVKEFDFQGNKIEVLQYLPIEDKHALVFTVLQNTQQSTGLYDHVNAEMYFHLYLVYMYSNLNFTDKQKEAEDKIYDALSSNGLLDMIISNIPETEYNFLYSMITAHMKEDLEYNTTASAIINKLINDLPAQAEAMSDILNNFDPDKFTMVKEFAKAANGGRDI